MPGIEEECGGGKERPPAGPSRSSLFFKRRILSSQVRRGLEKRVWSGRFGVKGRSGVFGGGGFGVEGVEIISHGVGLRLEATACRGLQGFHDTRCVICRCSLAGTASFVPSVPELNPQLAQQTVARVWKLAGGARTVDLG